MDKADRVIASISFLHRGERVTVKASKFGKFRLPVTNIVEGRVKTAYKNLTAQQVVEHPQVKGGDPVLTLTNGDKVRVFHGGDKSYLIPSAEGVIIKHDSTLRKKILKKSIPKGKKTISLGPSIKKELDDDVWASDVYGFMDMGILGDSD